MSKLLRHLFYVTTYVIIFTQPVESQENFSIKNDIKFANNISENTVQLTLNGLGVRTYYFVDVYVAGLYTAVKSQKNDEILLQKSPKLIRMHYFRDIKKSDLIKVWNYVLNEECKPDCLSFQTAFKEFESSIVDIKEGTEISYYFDTQFVEVRNPDRTVRIEKENFDKVLLSTWIGKNPPTEKLKNGLLGK
jgi:hypothetical protein